MNVNDWCEVPTDDNIYMFSANGVPYPHDEWLRLQGKMTVHQTVELLKRWPEKMNK